MNQVPNKVILSTKRFRLDIKDIILDSHGFSTSLKLQENKSYPRSNIAIMTNQISQNILRFRDATQISHATLRAIHPLG